MNKTGISKKGILLVTVAAAILVAQLAAFGEEPPATEPAAAQSAAEQREALAKAAQNPVASMISVPLQNNFNFGIGPNNITQWVLNVQPFINYNLPQGWYLTSAPIMTANWEVSSDNRWTVPLGGGAGKITKIGRLPVNLQLSAYGNVVTPDNGPDWQLRFQVQLLFPG